MSLRITILFIVSFLCTTAVAQMDKDGNFHWDELYTPGEILELDMSLPNKVEVSKIKNREQVKYVKLKCYPWIEHIPFTPEDFPNIEALRIESFLIQGLNGIDGFKKIKRLEVTDIEGRGTARALLRTNLPCVSNPIWEMTWLEELRIKGIDILVTENTISKLRNIKYLNINTFNEFYGCVFFDEFEKLASLRQIYFGKEDANLTLYLAKTFSEKGIDVVGVFNVDNISSISVTKGNEEDYMLSFDSEKMEWDEIIRYKPWAFDEISRRVYDIKKNEITMYVKKENGKVVFLKSQRQDNYSLRLFYYNYNYLTSKKDIKKYVMLPTPKFQQEYKVKEVECSYFDYSNSRGEGIPHIGMLVMRPSSDTTFEGNERGLYIFSDTLTYSYRFDFYAGESQHKYCTVKSCSPTENKSVSLIETFDWRRFSEFDYKKNMLREVGCPWCGSFIIHNNELLFGSDEITDFAVGCCCGDPWDCLNEDFDYFNNMKRGNRTEDVQEFNLLCKSRDTIIEKYKQQFEPVFKYVESRNVERLRNMFDL